ncbi:ABC transporter permease [symbiont of Argiope bruennichi]|uniref:FtsX-like permease family protein n=1 Tax=symbiont of Argiope bruennichi TaxID=2810479 RepID=UPI003DA3C458
MLIRRKLFLYFHKYFKRFFVFYLIYFILLTFLIIVFNGISTPLNGNLIFNDFWKKTKGYDFYLNFSQLKTDPLVQNKTQEEIDKLLENFSPSKDLYFQWDKKISPLSLKWKLINDHETFMVNQQDFSFITFPESKNNQWKFDYFLYKKNKKPVSNVGPNKVYSVYISNSFAKNYHLQLNSKFDLNYDISDPSAKITIKVASIDYNPRRIYNRETIFEGMNKNFIFLLNDDIKELQQKIPLNYYYSCYFKYQNENFSESKKNSIFSQLNNRLLQDPNLKVISLTRKFDFNDMNTFYFQNYSVSVYYIVILFILMLSIFLFSIFFICLESYLSKLSVSLAVLKINGYKKSEIIRSLLSYFSFWFLTTFSIAYFLSFYTTKYFLHIYLSPFILPTEGYHLNNYIVLGAFILIYGAYLLFIILVALRKLSKNSLATINNLSDLLILRTQRWKKIFEKFSFFIRSVVNLFVSYFKNSLFFFAGIFVTTFLILSSFVFNFSIFALSNRYNTVNNFNSQYILTKPFFYPDNANDISNRLFFSHDKNLAESFNNSQEFLDALKQNKPFSINNSSLKNIKEADLIKKLLANNYKEIVDYVKKVYGNKDFLMSFNEYYLDQNTSLSFSLSYVAAKIDQQSTNFQILSIPEQTKDKLTTCFPLLTDAVLNKLNASYEADPEVIPLIGNSYFYKNYKDFYNKTFSIAGINDKKFKVIDYLENDFSFFPCVYSYLPQVIEDKSFFFDGNYVYYKDNTDYQSFFNVNGKYQSSIFIKTSNQEIKKFIDEQFKIFIIIFWILIVLSSLISIVFTFIFMEFLLRKNRILFTVFKATGYKNSFVNFIFLTVYALSLIIGSIFAMLASYYILQELYTILTNKIILPIFFVFKPIWILYTVVIMLIIVFLSYIAAKKKLKLKNLADLLKIKE